jgi:molybdate transport system regulatory protein
MNWKDIKNTTPAIPSSAAVRHLARLHLERLTDTFQMWHEAAPSGYLRRVRGRYWLAFLCLRFTGARIGEVLRIDDRVDIDYERAEIHIANRVNDMVPELLRTIPVPNDFVARLLAYLGEFPQMRGRVFALDQGNFRREFYRRAQEAAIPRQLSHPHILRHTRAIELLEAGVPVTLVQDILGHTLPSTTAIYLRRTDLAVKTILSDKGLL